MERTIIEKGRATLDIKFQTNKADIQPQYHEELARFADIIKRHPEFGSITIEGHTDSVGDAGYNQKLSQRRAESVRNYLITKLGVDAERLSAKGFGESKPIADNMVASGRLQNRRVEAAVDYTVEKKVKE
jgi:OOP family OmpA-OmpF porin